VVGAGIALLLPAKGAVGFTAAVVLVLAGLAVAVRMGGAAPVSRP
jgi:hypothetical protein